jgi:hypothetical protein
VGISGATGVVGATGATGVAGVTGATGVFVSPGQFSQTGATGVANVTGPSGLLAGGAGTLTIPANTFTAGVAYRFITGGLFRDAANNTRIRFRMNCAIPVSPFTVTVFDSGSLGLPNIATLIGWRIDMVFVYYSPNLVTNFEFTFNSGSARGFTSQAVSTSFNPFVNNTFGLTVEWGTASANNTIQTNFAVMTRIF